MKWLLAGEKNSALGCCKSFPQNTHLNSVCFGGVFSVWLSVRSSVGACSALGELGGGLFIRYSLIFFPLDFSMGLLGFGCVFLVGCILSFWLDFALHFEGFGFGFSV